MLFRSTAEKTGNAIIIYSETETLSKVASTEMNKNTLSEIFKEALGDHYNIIYKLNSSKPKTSGSADDFLNDITSVGIETSEF